MGGPAALAGLTYLAVLVFIAGVIARAAKYARAPMHLRWELYPVPHEKGRAYGGSYFEELDWWTHPREKSLSAEIRAMLEEMLLIKSLWRHNRLQWYASFPFHFGLYLLVGLIVLLSVGAGIAPVLGEASSLWNGYQILTSAVGFTGLAAATLGAILLLRRRIVDPVLREASSSADYFNLAFLLAVFLSAGFAAVAADPTFVLLRGYVRGVLTLNPVPAVHSAVATEVGLTSLFMIYLPFTHMTHFVAKYFTYHQVRWDDAPNLNDAAIQARMQVNLGRTVGWSAPHIQSDKSWAEAATEVK
jgi:nitrate reductase gamma subunit